MRKRFLCASALLFSSVLALASCGSDSDKDKTTLPNTTETENPAPTDTSVPEPALTENDIKAAKLNLVMNSMLDNGIELSVDLGDLVKFSEYSNEFVASKGILKFKVVNNHIAGYLYIEGNDDDFEQTANIYIENGMVYSDVSNVYDVFNETYTMHAGKEITSYEISTLGSQMVGEVDTFFKVMELNITEKELVDTYNNFVNTIKGISITSTSPLLKYINIEKKDGKDVISINYTELDNSIDNLYNIYNTKTLKEAINSTVDLGETCAYDALLKFLPVLTDKSIRELVELANDKGINVIDIINGLETFITYIGASDEESMILEKIKYMLTDETASATKVYVLLGQILGTDDKDTIDSALKGYLENYKDTVIKNIIKDVVDTVYKVPSDTDQLEDSSNVQEDVSTGEESENIPTMGDMVISTIDQVYAMYEQFHELYFNNTTIEIQTALDGKFDSLTISYKGFENPLVITLNNNFVLDESGSHLDKFTYEQLVNAYKDTFTTAYPNGELVKDDNNNVIGYKVIDTSVFEDIKYSQTTTRETTNTFMYEYEYIEGESEIFVVLSTKTDVKTSTVTKNYEIVDGNYDKNTYTTTETSTSASWIEYAYCLVYNKEQETFAYFSTTLTCYDNLILDTNEPEVPQTGVYGEEGFEYGKKFYKDASGNFTMSVYTYQIAVDLELEPLDTLTALEENYGCSYGIYLTFNDDGTVTYSKDDVDKNYKVLGIYDRYIICYNEETDEELVIFLTERDGSILYLDDYNFYPVYN